jgi:hypothetical protein
MALAPHHEQPELSLQRTFSGTDAGGIFGGDGGVLNNTPSNHQGWCARLNTGARTQDPEKAESTSSGTTDWEVRWEDSDVDNPRNLKKWRKWLCTWVVSSASLCV